MGHDDTPDGKPPTPDPGTGSTSEPDPIELRLRDDVRFSDGTPVDKEAIRRSLDAAKAAGGGGAGDPAKPPPPPKAPPDPELPPGADLADGGPSVYEIRREPDNVIVGDVPPGADLADGGPSAYEIKGEPDGAATGGAGAHVGRWAAIAAGVVVAIVIGVILAMGGGDDDEQDAGGKTSPTTAAGGGAAGPQPGTSGFLAGAGLPTDLAYTATNVETGQSFRSTLRVNSSCTGNPCTYTSSFPPGQGMVRGPIPTVTWSHNGTSWHVVLTAPILSSSTNGADCVYMYTDTWDLTVLGAERGGGLLRAVQLKGTLRRDQKMDPAYSQAGIAAKTCLDYNHSDTYNITATPA